ncbi:MAG: zinc ribbon domain-containing protein [Chloroflexi bacterium]|nr:zinc ribbon domain-containing protein [Chloroflexota bacterium]
MPTYEFRCNQCGRKVTLVYKTYADYDQAAHTCSHCQSTNLTRLISRVAIQRSPISRLMSDRENLDDSALEDLTDADPRTMGQMLRAMGEEVGQEIGPEFDEVVGRLERGQSPEEIESAMPDLMNDVSMPDAGASPMMPDTSGGGLL